MQRDACAVCVARRTGFAFSAHARLRVVPEAGVAVCVLELGVTCEGPTRPSGTVLCCGSVPDETGEYGNRGRVGLVGSMRAARVGCTSNQRTRSPWLVRLVARGRTASVCL